MGCVTHSRAEREARHDSGDDGREGGLRSGAPAPAATGARPGAGAHPGQGDGAGRGRSGNRRGRPGRAGQHRRGDGGHHDRGAGQPGRARAGAGRHRQRGSRRRRARHQGHQQRLGGLSYRPAALAGRDRSRAGRLRAGSHAPAIECLHAECPGTGTSDREDQRLRLISRQGAGRHDRCTGRRRSGRRDRRRTRPARRKDVLAHRSGADLQLRRGGGAVQAARQANHLPRTQLRGRQGSDDPCRRPRADRRDERPGVQHDRRRRRRVGHRGRAVARSPAGRRVLSSSSPPTTPPHSRKKRHFGTAPSGRPR